VAKKVIENQEVQAPAYMVQYGGLMALLLAFFVTLQTLGDKKTHKFKRGIGDIQNAFGLKGGFGVLPYWKTFREWSGGSYPDVKKEPGPEEDFLGFMKGMLWRAGLDEGSVLRVDLDPLGATAVIATPMQFAAGDAGLAPESRRFLDRIGAVFYDLPDCSVSVCCLAAAQPEPEAARQQLAVERAATVARYLGEKFGDGIGTVRALGYAHARFATFATGGESVALLIRKNRRSEVRWASPR
jgi:hypothetical protein